MSRIDLGELGLQLLGNGGHRRGAVPQVRVRRVVGEAQDLLRVDDDAGVVGRCAREVVHEVVVAEAVLNEDLRLAQLPGDARVGLEGVRIGVRVAEDRADGHVVAADLLRDVGVFVLRGHDRDRARGARRGRGGGVRCGGAAGQGDRDGRDRDGSDRGLGHAHRFPSIPGTSSRLSSILRFILTKKTAYTPGRCGPDTRSSRRISSRPCACASAPRPR